VHAVDVLRAKRDGHRLSDAQIDWVIDAFVCGEVADEQMSALLMAIVWRGMAPEELARWTAAMIDSGDRLDLSSLRRPTVDKHSTGGVGDKISLPLVPLVAACGAAVPQLSGRGLGHTGGTLDKMDSIPGWGAQLSKTALLQALSEVGGVISAAGDELVPADRKLYALRDVTATVESIPLIASSIMSKKIAEGTSALVLDVKVGSGAFLPSLDSARDLAKAMMALGDAHGVRTTALLTAMDTPLGRAVGNALEVTEACEILAGGGPADAVELTLALARDMLDLAGLPDADPAGALAGGRAMDTWHRMVRAQGGDPTAELPVAQEVEYVRASRDGVLTQLDARAVGIAAWRLGAGRSRKEDQVSPIAGVLCLHKPGDVVRAGEPILALHLDDPSRLDAALEALSGGIEIAASANRARPVILERLGPSETPAV
jgi:thymidine phosphorylase